jgi:RNA polymerase sigma-70 factor (ECF subfamily)
MMCQSERRVAHRREALAARFVDASVEVAAPSLAALDGRRVAACLRSLAERERLVVLLTYYADREAPRIARDLDLSPGAVRVIRHRAIARLRACVTGGGRP